jgi:hypothetical protein
LKKDKNTLNLENRRGGVDFRMQTEEEAWPPEGSPELSSVLFFLSAFGSSAAIKLTNILEAPATYSHLFVTHKSGVTKEPHPHPYGCPSVFFVTPLFLYRTL